VLGSFECASLSALLKRTAAITQAGLGSHTVRSGTAAFKTLRYRSRVPVCISKAITVKQARKPFWNCELLLVFRLMRRATNLIQVCITHFWNKNFTQFTLHYFIIGEDIDHADVIFRTGPRATYMVLAGDLVPAGTTLVTPAVKFLVWENTIRKELQPLELTSKNYRIYL